VTLVNQLFYGDNLTILREHVRDESVDLVYLDPPFNSNQDYNVLFAERDGSRAVAQIKAFTDTWQWDEGAARSYQGAVEAGGPVSQALQAFRTFLGENDMLAYLAMMAPRLVELRRVMKPTASIYLHCDPTASHYLKILLDAVFGPTQFRNEIIWRRTGSHNSPRRYGPIHDLLLFYSKTDGYYFKRTFRPYLRGHVESYFRSSDARGRYWTNALTGAGVRHGDSGKPWRSYSPTQSGRHWAMPSKIVEEAGIDESLTIQEKLDLLDAGGYIDHPPSESGSLPTYRQYLQTSPGMPLQDIWAYQPHTKGVLYASEEGIDQDVRWLVAQGDLERLGYQTQKPQGLLCRVIQSSCPDEGVVLDPFCGCGTTIAAAAMLKRQWVGIDITSLATTLIKNRLRDTYGQEIEKTYQVIGEPVSLPDAERLAREDPYQFQWWALGLVGARPVEQKKGADKGIDGRIYFHDEGEGKDTKQIIISVKAGALHATYVRDLRGVVEREHAEIGVLLSLEDPTKAMRKEAASSGFYTSNWGQHPRIQLLTVRELLAGKRIDCPPLRQTDRTFKRAPRAGTYEGEQESLPLVAERTDSE